MMTEKTKYEAELKKKLENFEPSGYSSHWNGIKNKLPHQGKPFWFKAVVVSGIAAIIAGVIIFSLPNNNENIDTSNPDASSQENHVVDKTHGQNIQTENSSQNNESDQICITKKSDDNTVTPTSDNHDENSEQAGNNEDTHMSENTSESFLGDNENEVISENQIPENNCDNADNADNKQPAEH
ncbi:MAG: hypothetical protein PF590_06030, partial [Candidatus Delongbacteria bacterium]|nr:hypothetical protein [Candidatus Delongbacteria bacterium]